MALDIDASWDVRTEVWRLFTKDTTDALSIYT